MAAVKLAARAVEEEENRRGEEEAREEKGERAVVAAVGDGERGGLANSSSPLPVPIPLSRPWRLVARAQAALNKHWASAAAWRQAARLTEDEEGSAREDEARAAEQDAAAAADAAARYG